LPDFWHYFYTKYPFFDAVIVFTRRCDHSSIVIKSFGERVDIKRKYSLASNANGGVYVERFTGYSKVFQSLLGLLNVLIRDNRNIFVKESGGVACPPQGALQ